MAAFYGLYMVDITIVNRDYNVYELIGIIMFMNQLPIYVQLTMFHMMYNLKLHGGYNVYNQLIDMVSP